MKLPRLAIEIMNNADRLTKELRHVRVILKTFDMVGVGALLSGIEVCPGEVANASAARALNLIDDAKVAHSTIMVADLARLMQDIVVLTRRPHRACNNFLEVGQESVEICASPACVR